MRIVGCLVLGLMLSGQALGLEASAGADNVNASQVGINAKIDAGNAAMTAVLNKMLNCSKNGQGYSSTTDSCVGLTTTQQTAMLNCNNNKQFYNSATGSCAGGGNASITQSYVSPVYALIKNRNTQTYPLGTHGLCVLNLIKGSTSQPRGGCSIAGAPGGSWSVSIYSYDDSARWCQATCYEVQ